MGVEQYEAVPGPQPELPPLLQRPTRVNFQDLEMIHC
jgi:hypothetical protein